LLAVELGDGVGDLAWGWQNLVLGQAKNDGYQRAGRGVVSTGGRSRWGRINNSPVCGEMLTDCAAAASTMDKNNKNGTQEKLVS
jgi:hypothetical protein